jgi:hypothetical protein
MADRCHYVLLCYAWEVECSRILGRIARGCSSQVRYIYIFFWFVVNPKLRTEHVLNLTPFFLLDFAIFTSAVLTNIFRLWTRRRYILPKRRLTFRRLHGVITRKIELFFMLFHCFSSYTIIFSSASHIFIRFFSKFNDLNYYWIFRALFVLCLKFKHVITRAVNRSACK